VEDNKIQYSKAFDSICGLHKAIGKSDSTNGQDRSLSGMHQSSKPASTQTTTSTSTSSESSSKPNFELKK
jgi:hypothetical protein